MPVLPLPRQRLRLHTGRPAGCGPHSRAQRLLQIEVVGGSVLEAGRGQAVRAEAPMPTTGRYTLATASLTAAHVRQRPFGPAGRQVIGNWPGIGFHRDQRFTAHALVGQLRPPGRITDLVARRL